MRPKLILVSVVVCLLAAGSASADVLALQATRDNTLYESNFGALSNGAGDHFFTGLTASFATRRGILAFDVASSLPAGSTVNSVTLTLYMSRTNSGSHPVSLHRALGDWGESTSHSPGQEGTGTAPATGDTTWLHTFHDTAFWTNPGGDYSGIPSATTSVGGIGFHSWSSAALADDVQGWLDNPSGDFGWILIGNEASGTSTSKRFESRTNASVTRRPVLTVDFTPPVVDGACCAANDTCSIDTSAGCASGGGTFQGLGSDCSPNPCLDPTGACCDDDGACVELSTASCALSGGVHQGNGTTCGPGTCPEPTGACCADDGTCGTQTESVCDAQGGTYQGNGSSCAAAQCPVILEPFVDALPLPAVAQPTSGTPGGAATYTIAVTEFQQQLHRDLPPTTLWGYGGTFPGPTIEAAAYEPVTVNWVNDIRDSVGTLRTQHYLPVDLCPHGPNFEGPNPRTVVHLHGAHVRAEYDGYPEDTILPGEQQTYIYTNDQLPATLWYHDHALGITRLNVYLGMSAFYLIRDPFEQALNLPSGLYEIPLLVQDRTFNTDGSLAYPAEWVEHFFGDTVLVNGKVWPYLDVDRGKYRFRLLNGSGSRTYTFGLSTPGLQFQQIGTDGGLLPAPIALDEITLAPAERADVVIDFAGLAPGTEVTLTNSAPAPFPGGTDVIPNVMKFVVSPQAGDTTPLPSTLRPLEVLQEADSVATRDFELFLTPDSCTGSAWSINGLRWNDITEYPFLGTTEIWRWINKSGMTHPMHMHLVMFQVLDRQPFDIVGGVPTPSGPAVPPEANELGWKDTVRANPGEITRVIARFEDYKGKFAYHCHIVEHEDNEMMRQFETIECGDGQLDPSEQCDDGNTAPDDGCTETCRAEEFLELTGLAQGGTVQILVGGVTIYGLAFSGQTPEQVVASLAGSINSNSTLAAQGVTARTVGSRLYVTGSLSITSNSDPGLDERLVLGVGRTGIWWSRVVGGATCDVVRGDLVTLRSTGGDFTAATADCHANDEAAARRDSPETPAPGQGTWYLVRTAGGPGTYDSGEASQVAARDAGIAASGNGCPDPTPVGGRCA